MSLSGALKHTFNFAAYGTLGLASFVVGGYFGSLFFDPFFFPVIHDPSNTMGQALIKMTTETFGLIHEWMGLTGDGGLMNWGPIKEFMAPWLAKVTPVIPSVGIGEDTLMNLSTKDL